MAPEERSPPGQEAGGGRDGTGEGPFSAVGVVHRRAGGNGFDPWPEADFPIASPDPLAPLFAADYYELRALQRRRERVAP